MPADKHLLVVTPPSPSTLTTTVAAAHNVSRDSYARCRNAILPVLTLAGGVHTITAIIVETTRSRPDLLLSSSQRYSWRLWQ